MICYFISSISFLVQYTLYYYFSGYPRYYNKHLQFTTLSEQEVLLPFPACSSSLRSFFLCILTSFVQISAMYFLIFTYPINITRYCDYYWSFNQLVLIFTFILPALSLFILSYSSLLLCRIILLQFKDTLF